VLWCLFGLKHLFPITISQHNKHTALPILFSFEQRKNCVTTHLEKLFVRRQLSLSSSFSNNISHIIHKLIITRQEQMLKSLLLRITLHKTNEPNFIL
jgi:hypothetical protein